MNEMQGDASSSHGTEKPNVIKVSSPGGGVEANRSRENISSLRSNAGHCVDFSPPKNILKRSNANKNVVLTANVVTVAKDNNAIPREKTTHKMQQAGTPIGSIHSALDLEANEGHQPPHAAGGNFISPPLGVKDASNASSGSSATASGQGYLPMDPRSFAHHPSSYVYSGMRHSMEYHAVPPHHPAMYAYRPDMYYQHHMSTMRSNPSYNNSHGMYLVPQAHDKEGSIRGEKLKTDMNRTKEKEGRPSNREDKPLSQSPKGKATPLLRSPPPKKRKFVTSWDDTEREEYAYAASPGVFSSPLPNAFVRNKDFGLEFKRSPGFDIANTPGKFDLNDPSLRIDTPGRTMKIDDSLFGKSFDELDHDDDELLHGIDTNERIMSASPKMTFDANDVCDDITNPHFNLSPLGSHDFSPFPGRDIIGETVKDPDDDDPDEHFPFKKFGSSPLSLKQKNVSKKSALPLPVLSKDDKDAITVPKRRDNSPSINVLGFHGRHGSYMRSNFGSPIGFRMEFGLPHGTITDEPKKDAPKTKSPHHRTHQAMMQAPAKNQISILSTPSTIGKPPPYAGSAPRLVHYQVPVPRPQVKTPLSTVSAASLATPSRSLQTSTGSAQKKTPLLERRQPCNCKKSKCLKLYCECFAAQIMCSGCNCIDCHNTPNHEDIRNKAIKDTKMKNSSAFKPRSNAVNNAHISGCKCKKSKCLKKYCECFESGYICSTKCKCSDCQNFPGSKLLAERRKKVKDGKGAEDAMRQPKTTKVTVSSAGRNQPQSMYPPSSTPLMMQHEMAMMMNSPNFMTQGHVMLPPNRMYSPNPAYHSFYPHAMQTPQIPPGIRKQAHITVVNKPKTPSRRDPLKSKKEGGEMILKEYFGPKNGLLDKRALIGIFSFLSNEELYNASIVSKSWSKIATDDELWTFE